MVNRKLTREIVQMAKLDQEARKDYEKDPAIFRRVKAIDRSNLVIMKRIVKEFGWPTVSLVGKRASHMAWLLVQHADSCVEFQKCCLGLMKKALKVNDISKANIAYLTDRILVGQGKPQIYGSQFYRSKAGRLVPRPIKNIRALHMRRQEMSLEGFGLYKKKLAEAKAL